MSRKRGNGEGSVRKTESGSWRGELMDGYTPEGKKNVVRFSGKTKSEVLQKIRNYQTLRDEQVNLDEKMRLEQWANLWYQDYQSQVQPSTYSGYRYTLKIIKDFFGKQKLTEVRAIQINNFQDALVERGYSLSQIRKCRAMLIQIFDAAEDNGLLPRNPARKAKPLRDNDGSLSKPRRLKDAFTEEELERLWEKLPGGLVGHGIRLMLDTGLRVQELIALGPEDISEDGSTVLVNKAIKMVDGVATMGPPKSKRSNRVIPIPREGRDSARYLREHGRDGLIWRGTGENPYYTVGAFRRRYYTALKEVGEVRLLSPHCCRHTYITRLQASGVSIELIARLAGHSNIETTDGYAHPSEATLAGIVNALDKKGGNEYA